MIASLTGKRCLFYVQERKDVRICVLNGGIRRDTNLYGVKGSHLVSAVSK